MRLKVYTAATMNEAMERVRADLGADAMIVATESLPDGGVAITAALEPGEPGTVAGRPGPGPFAAGEDLDPGAVVAVVRHALAFHGVPPALVDRLSVPASKFAAQAPLVALAGALEASFGFAPIALSGGRERIIVVGQPGAGKTLAVAKLAMRLRVRGRRAVVVSADTRRAGAVDQLAAYTAILGFELIVAEDARDVDEAAARADAPLLVDTAGLDPFLPADRALLAELIDAADAEPLLVMAGGGDPMECIDVASAFADLGAHRLFAAKLDLARRLGGLLAATDAARTSFAEASTSYQVAAGLVPLNAVALARLMLPTPTGATLVPQLEEAVP